MAEMEERINAVLSDPALMAQLSALAQSMGGASTKESATAQEGPTAADTAVDAPPRAQSAPAQEATQAADAAALLAGLLGGGTDSGTAKLLGGLLHEKKDENTALLLALRPFLREERREMVDQVLQITRLSQMARSLLQLFQGGDEHV